MKQNIFLASIILLFGIPGLVLADPIIRSGESVSVEADQVLEGDFYGLGGTVVVSGEAEHDVYVGGGSVTINAPIKGDLAALGGIVQVHAQVEDDVRVVGGEVVIAEPVLGDVIVLGGEANILSTASVGGDVVFFGGILTVSGEVKGSIVGRAETMRIDAGVGEDVSVTVSRSFSLGDRTEILGNLEYESPHDLARAQGAVVVGNIQKKTPHDAGEIDMFALLLPFLVVMFAALTALLLFRSALDKLVGSITTSYGIYGLIGLALFLALPFVGVLLSASVLGMVVGMILLVTYVLLLLISWVLAGIVLGTFVLLPITRSKRVTLLSVLTGIFLFNLILFIPFVGFVIAFALMCIVLGGISAHLYAFFRKV